MNNYKKENDNNQVVLENFLMIPSYLERFVNVKTNIVKNDYGNDCYIFYGYVILNNEDLKCNCCGSKMHIHTSTKVRIKHCPIGQFGTYICIDKKQLKCSHCGATKMQTIPFQAKKHNITIQLETYITDLLSRNKFTNKDIAFLSGVNRNVVKDIDKERLMGLYTIDGLGKELIKPSKYVKYLVIDEFKLHNGYQYATHIIDYETGHILWIARGKKKQVVYDFINHVGLEWMSHVEAIACDMNSDFEEAFKEKCPHLKIVYDYFHIVKNLNDKVINPIRKSECNRLINEKQYDKADKFKKSKYILTSNKETLEIKDKEIKEGKITKKNSDLFTIPQIIKKPEYINRYNELIQSNEKLLVIDLIKMKLKDAYSRDEEVSMAEDIMDIVILCYGTNNDHFISFAKLIINHYDGIIAHAKIKISSGKIEGINNKIKTLRRMAYGYPDDEYFFLKLFDMSRA